MSNCSVTFPFLLDPSPFVQVKLSSYPDSYDITGIIESLRCTVQDRLAKDPGASHMQFGKYKSLSDDLTLVHGLFNVVVGDVGYPIVQLINDGIEITLRLVQPIGKLYTFVFVN